MVGITPDRLPALDALMLQLLRDSRADPRGVFVEGLAIAGFGTDDGQLRHQLATPMKTSWLPRSASARTSPGILARSTAGRAAPLCCPIGRGRTPARGRNSASIGYSAPDRWIGRCRRCRRCGGSRSSETLGSRRARSSSPCIGGRGGLSRVGCERRRRCCPTGRSPWRHRRSDRTPPSRRAASDTSAR